MSRRTAGPPRGARGSGWFRTPASRQKVSPKLGLTPVDAVDSVDAEPSGGRSNLSDPVGCGPAFVPRAEFFSRRSDFGSVGGPPAAARRTVGRARLHRGRAERRFRSERCAKGRLLDPAIEASPVRRSGQIDRIISPRPIQPVGLAGPRKNRREIQGGGVSPGGRFDWSDRELRGREDDRR